MPCAATAKRLRSHTKHHRPRILQSPPETRRPAAAELSRHSRRFRLEVCFWRSLLQVSPGSGLSLPNRYMLHNPETVMVAKEDRLQGTRRARDYREGGRRRPHLPPLRTTQGYQG